MIRIIGLTLAVALVAPAASAEQYWIAYEGNDFPEDVGWERHFGDEEGEWHGGAERWIEDGALVVDSRRHQMIFDYSRFEREIDPDPGELFVATWRLYVVETYGFREAGVAIAPDGGGTLAFKYYVDEIVSTREDWSYPITPGEYHTYRVESLDMVSYRLWIDDDLVREGAWDLDSLNYSFVTFGDGAQGGDARSLTKWDYVRFGAVPEPSSALLVLVAGVFCACTRRRQD